MTLHRLSVDRLELDLRGVAPELARAAVELLGPALERALVQRAAAGVAPAARRDARPFAAGAQGLADHIAHQLAAGALALPHGDAS